MSATIHQHPNINPFLYTDGNRDAEVLIISEHFTAEEQHKNKPLVGSAGWEFRKICTEAGLSWDNTLRAVVIPERPLGNDIRHFFHPTMEVKKTKAPFKEAYPKQIILNGLVRIANLIEAMPNLRLIIGLGNIPLWLFTEDKASVSTVQGYKVPGGVSKWRGSQLYASNIEKAIPYLPIISPITILKDWTLRHITVHDIKARAVRFLTNATKWDREEPNFLPHPTYGQAMDVLRKWQARVSLGEYWLSADIETWRRSFISCIGLADEQYAICIPFFYFDPAGKMVQVFTSEQEEDIWLALRALLSHPNARVIGQNFIYDTQFLNRLYFIDATLAFDTMLAHHLLWPGTPKGLDRLASLYCEHYVYWKDESQDWDGVFNHESLWLYNCKDVRETYDIAMVLRNLIEKLNFSEQWNLQLEQWHLAKRMMLTGCNADKAYLNRINLDLMQLASDLEQELLFSMPEDLRFAPSGKPWYNSPTFQMKIFYDILGFKPVLHKKTKRPTLDATALPILREQNPWLATVFQTLEDLRSIAVFRSHFLEMKLSIDNRFLCNFNVGGTETFRWSSSANGFGEGTNFQNIPKGDD